MQEVPDQVDWKYRGEAAAKTVTVLKQRVRSLYNEGAQTAIHRQLERARERQETQRRNREVMTAKNEELQRHSAALEGTVARRTAELRAILDNVTFGFVVVDRKCAVLPGFTASCADLLSQEVREGHDVCNLLEMTGTSDDPMFRMGMEQIFDDFMPEEVSVEQLPTQFKVGGRCIQAECRPIRAADGSVENVLVTISDVTSLFEAERRAQQNAALIGILRQKSAFAAFLSDARGRITSCRDEISNQPFVRRSIHTIKGNAASYGLTDLAAVTNQAEEQAEITAAEIQLIEQALNSFLETHAVVLGKDLLAGEDSIEIGATELCALRSFLDPLDPGALKAWGKSIIHRPIAEFMGPLEVFVGRVAETLERSVSFEVEGLDTLVDPQVMQPVISTLTHLIRNALDHGIEPESERAGKSPTGRLSLECREENSEWVIELEDDGRGIEVDQLVRRAIDQGTLTPAVAASLSTDQKIDLIFCDGLSSREVATDLSGRGVGMSAVREAVEQQGGRIVVQTKQGAGTKFCIVVPIGAQ